MVRLRKAGLTVNTLWHSSLLASHDLPFTIEQLPSVFTEFRVGVEKAKVVVQAPEDAVTVVPLLPDGFILSNSVALNQSTRTHLQPLDSLAQSDARSSLTFSIAHDFAGTQGGLRHTQQYFERQLAHSYKATRNQLSGLDYSTKFSVWLASGALSARMLYQQLQAFEAEHGANDGSYWIWFELLWRDLRKRINAVSNQSLMNVCLMRVAQSSRRLHKPSCLSAGVWVILANPLSTQACVN